MNNKLARGIEPPTSCLQNRCSTVELRQQELLSCFPKSLWHGSQNIAGDQAYLSYPAGGDVTGEPMQINARLGRNKW